METSMRQREVGMNGSSGMYTAISVGKGIDTQGIHITHVTQYQSKSFTVGEIKREPNVGSLIKPSIIIEHTPVIYEQTFRFPKTCISISIYPHREYTPVVSVEL